MAAPESETNTKKTYPFPTPKFVTGGCNCKAIRYRADFLPDHDFYASSGSCQCTQCRRQTGSLFFFSHRIPQRANFRFTTTPTSTPPATLKIYRASAHGERGFCGECGCFLFWRLLDDGTPETDYTAIAVGSVDPLYLFGEGADGFEVPEGGFGIALANGGGEHSWCANEMKGVTDGMEVLGRGRGLRRQGD